MSTLDSDCRTRASGPPGRSDWAGVARHPLGQGRELQHPVSGGSGSVGSPPTLTPALRCLSCRVETAAAYGYTRVKEEQR